MNKAERERMMALARTGNLGLVVEALHERERQAKVNETALTDTPDSAADNLIGPA